MPRLINLSLLNPSDMIVIGSIMFFWACMAYVIAENLASASGQ